MTAMKCIISIKTNTIRFAQIQIILVFFAFFSGIMFGQPADSIASFDKAKEVALSESKFILVSFNISAQEMLNDVRSSPRSPTGIINQRYKGGECLNFYFPNRIGNKFVGLLITAPSESELRSKYCYEGKTTVVFDGFGNELYAEECRGRTHLMTILKAMPDNASQYYSLLQDLKTHPDSVKLKLQLADQCEGYRAYTASNRYYEEIRKSSGFENDSSLADHVGSRTALNAYLYGDLDKAEDLFSDHIKKFPHSVERPMQLYLLTDIQVEKKKKDDAIRYLQLLQVEFPSDPHTTWAKKLVDEYKD